MRSWPPKLRLALGLAAGFAVLAAIVALGVLDHFDQWAVDHLMPGVGPGPGSPSILSSVMPVFHPDRSHTHVGLSALTYAIVVAASALPSAIVVGVCLLVLWGRRRLVVAVALGAAFVVANLVELICKESILRDALYKHVDGAALHIGALDSSYPSGHATRAVLMAACVGACLPVLRWLLAAWIVAVAAMLVVGGWHTPSDVAGGLLLSTTLLLLADVAAAKVVARRAQVP